MSIHINETIIKQGIIPCENHEWTHDNNTMVLTCNPPIHVHKKICSKCGQIVKVREQTFIQNNFNEIYQKFHLSNDIPESDINLNWSVNKDNTIIMKARDLNTDIVHTNLNTNIIKGEL